MCTHYLSDDMLRWYFKQEWKNNWDHSHFNQFQLTASTVLIQQVPFSFSRYRSLVYILMSSRYLLFKFALPFSLARTYKRLVQPYRVSYNSAGIPKRFYALCFYPCAHSVDASFMRCRLNSSGQTILLNDRSDRSKPLRSIIDRKVNLRSIICRFFIIVKWIGLLLWKQYIIITVRLGIWDNSHLL